MLTLPNGTTITAIKGEWTEWKKLDCSRTCGDGERAVQRRCISEIPNRVIICNSVNGTVAGFEFDILSCGGKPCISGRPVVEKVLQDVRKNLADNGFKFDDKEFLKRYAESSTNFGESDTHSNRTGAGIWKLDDDALATILSVNVIFE